MNEQSSCRPTVERLVDCLERSGLIKRLELSDEDIADTIWLALQMGLANNTTEQEQPNFQERLLTIDNQGGTTAKSSTKENPTINVYSEELASQTITGGLPFPAPAAPALQNKLSIGRALRPLMRKVPSTVRKTLDPEATVTRIAETNIWLPVIQPQPERWLQLELVIEESRSSFIWTETIDELHKLLQNHGAFRTIRAWRLSSTGNDHLQLTKRTRDSQKSHCQHSYRELIHSNGRGLILLVSDCVSSIWQQVKIYQWLQKWSNKIPTAIIQLLPERLWQSSELGLGNKLLFKASKPGVPNSNLILPSPWEELKRKQVLKLPVVTLEAFSLGNWAKVVAGRGNTSTPGFVFDLEFVAEQVKQTQTAKPEELSPKNLVDRFLATASPTAQRLAGLMAAVPVNLPVIHLIQKQKTLLPQPATPVPIAEVFLSGIIQRVSRSENDKNPQYDFVPEARKILNRAMRLDKTEEVLDVVSGYIAENLGLSIKSFTALLLRHQDLSKEQQEQVLPFARVTIEVLQNLGGEYANFAKEVAGKIPPVTVVEPKQEQEVDGSSGITSEFDDLSNPRYTQLRDLLAAGNWKDADHETYLVMLKVVGRSRGDWIRDEELLNFPCTDLRTIDSLWVKYSSGRFGFSVQKKIYLEVGGIPDGKFDREAWEKFGDRVGWRRVNNKTWINNSQVTFDTTAPVGHLPCWMWVIRIYREVGYSNFIGYSNSIGNISSSEFDLDFGNSSENSPDLDLVLGFELSGSRFRDKKFSSLAFRLVNCNL